MANPLVPVLDYVVNYDYIANELCINKEKPQMHCNGMCYLKKELAKKVADESKDSKQVNFKKVELPVFFIEVSSYEIPSEPLVMINKELSRFSNSEQYQFLYEKQCLKPPIIV
ncbi:hypothetical protein NBRC110019_16680 [Neptunitalea chrysea]|uniref:Uncharacterized protein n=1 Tax=Neptunitalea chrysea TaxID=1647581 RepID=A0A9W6EW96_9FLAO|nr:hypothetical protein [Neptunitalea chrysea]GLB52628.1 hypothetical protein NBRC110019_16680 [Neptunitalea chrysea]